MFDTKISVNCEFANAFESDFEEFAVQPVQDLMNALMTTDNIRKKTRLRECILGDAVDEQLATEDCV